MFPRFSQATEYRIKAAERMALVHCINQIHAVWNDSLTPLLEGQPVEISEQQLYPAILDFAASRYDAVAEALLKIYVREQIEPWSQFGLLSAYYTCALFPHREAMERREADEGFPRDVQAVRARYRVSAKTAKQWIKEKEHRLSGGVDYDQEVRDFYGNLFPHVPMFSASTLCSLAQNTFSHPRYDDVEQAIDNIVKTLEMDSGGTLGRALFRRLDLRAHIWTAEGMKQVAELLALNPEPEPDDESLSDFGTWLDMTRNKAGMTIEVLSIESNVGERTIYDILGKKTKNPRQDVMNRLIQALRKRAGRDLTDTLPAFLQERLRAVNNDSSRLNGKVPQQNSCNTAVRPAKIRTKADQNPH